MLPETDGLDAKTTRRRSEDRLAADILEECRVQLMLKFRFLDLALWRMEASPLRAGAAYPLATDASQVVFDPPRVIARFEASFAELVRDYLHMVMHCVFRHPFAEGHANREAWNLTCDIVVESVCLDLCGTRFAGDDDAARKQALSEIALLAGSLAPSKVYQLVKGVVLTPDGRCYRGVGRSTLNAWHALFERDDHGAWPASNKDAPDVGELEPSAEEGMTRDDEHPDEAFEDAQPSQEAGADAPGEQDAEGREADAAPDAGNEGGEQDALPEADDAPGERADAGELERAWEDVAKQMEMNLETLAREWGDEAGALVTQLSAANRARYDYRAFLQRFAAPAEEMLLNQDEFDYIYYTYGMDLYGDMPLVEPLEYREIERVRDFVIAIDTSESVSGELVKRFVAHTFELLKSTQSYASEVNVRLIQCDARVQADMAITDLREVDALMEKFTVRGFGGTDFRPVFDYVETLRKQGVLTDLKGLVYFTDGLGRFPEAAPDYDAAFVFVSDGATEVPPVPPWAIKLVVDETDLIRFARGS